MQHSRSFRFAVQLGLIIALLFAFSGMAVSRGMTCDGPYNQWQWYMSQKEDAHQHWSAANDMYWYHTNNRGAEVTEALRSLGLSIAYLGMGDTVNSVASYLEGLIPAWQSDVHNFWRRHWDTQRTYWSEKEREFIEQERVWYTEYLDCLDELKKPENYTWDEVCQGQETLTPGGGGSGTMDSGPSKLTAMSTSSSTSLAVAADQPMFTTGGQVHSTLAAHGEPDLQVEALASAEEEAREQIRLQEEALARAQAREQARLQAEARARAEEEAREQARLQAEAQARAQARAEARARARARAQARAQARAEALARSRARAQARSAATTRTTSRSSYTSRAQITSRYASRWVM